MRQGGVGVGVVVVVRVAVAAAATVAVARGSGSSVARTRRRYVVVGREPWAVEPWVVHHAVRACSAAQSREPVQSIEARPCCLACCLVQCSVDAERVNEVE